MKALLQDRWPGFGDDCGGQGSVKIVFGSGVPLFFWDSQRFPDAAVRIVTFYGSELILCPSLL